MDWWWWWRTKDGNRHRNGLRRSIILCPHRSLRESVYAPGDGTLTLCYYRLKKKYKKVIIDHRINEEWRTFEDVSTKYRSESECFGLSPFSG